MISRGSTLLRNDPNLLVTKHRHDEVRNEFLEKHMFLRTQFPKSCPTSSSSRSRRRIASPLWKSELVTIVSSRCEMTGQLSKLIQRVKIPTMDLARRMLCSAHNPFQPDGLGSVKCRTPPAPHPPSPKSKLAPGPSILDPVKFASAPHRSPTELPPTLGGQLQATQRVLCDPTVLSKPNLT